MCGINGIFAYRESAPPVEDAELLRVREAMAKRGPDGAGLWVSRDRRVGLGHRRLTIIDISAAGSQPMATADGRFHITFNGEIYNYKALRKELERKGFLFRSQSDTEVLLHLYADCGADMVHALRGMYAFGIWDERDKTLFLARDPFGIKPLYYADDGKTLRFASQVKALLAGGGVETAPEPAGAAGFLLWGCVPEPFTLYRSIVALPSGSHLTLRLGAAPAIAVHFSVRGELERAQAEGRPFRPQDREALGELLRDSVKQHLVADVPVGVFLSAGVDSTLVTSLAIEHASPCLRTLTLGFDEYRGTSYDEVPFAEATAAALGTRHETRRVRRMDFAAEVEAIRTAMDQPSTDGVNSYFVCREASRAGLKVALSGLGGDELFGGYPSFRHVPRLARWLRPAALVPFVGKIARLGSAPLLAAFTSPKYASLLEYGGTYEGAYLLRRALFMPWELNRVLDPVATHVGLERLQTASMLARSIRNLDGKQTRASALELQWYMRNQLLRDADWAGMAHSLEVRVPFVDAMLFRALAPWLVTEDRPTKADAAATPRRPLRRELLERPKSGFSVPVHEWLTSGAARSERGLRGWAKQVLPRQPAQFRALVVVTDAFGGRGGISKFNRDLLSALAGMPDCAEVVAIPRLIPEVTSAIPSRIRYCADAAGSKWRFLRVVVREMFAAPFNLVICGHINLAPLAVMASLVSRARSLLVVHGIDAWRRHRSIIVRASLSHFDAIVGVSRLTLDRFASWSGVRSHRLRLLPNCVDLQKFAPGPKSDILARRLGLAGRTVIMTLGRLASEERYKGFDEVIDVLPSLMRDIPSIVYLICGDGPDRDRLAGKAKALGVSDRVVFAGFIPEEEKSDYYRLADAYVMPSRGEGFGIVLLEALSCGLPAMGSMLDGTREALLEGAMGVLVNPEQPEEVRRGILTTLACAKKVPEELSRFSSGAFSALAAGIAREVCLLD